MRPIGGELELKAYSSNSYFTDSGRSSLRLFLRSLNNKDKKYLLPNFYCSVIESIFIEENIKYSFYKINKNLTFDEKEILKNDFDVLYIINYFGIKMEVNSSTFEDKIIIEDNVFFNNFDNSSKYKNWFAFNSFRKISQLSSGSLIKTNLKLDLDLIKNSDASFHNIKNIAKNIKYEFVNNNLFSEEEYIDKFNEAENKINLQKDIYPMNSDCISHLISLDIKDEQIIRKKRFEQLFEIFPNECINKESLYYSFFIISIKNRDNFRKLLINNNIFLPIHWPKNNTNNLLYDTIISIPLFSIYTDKEFDYLINKIKGVYEKL